MTGRTTRDPAKGVGPGVEASGRRPLARLLKAGAALLVPVFITAAFWLYFPATGRPLPSGPGASARAAADAVVVSQKGDGRHRTIQAAVDAARPGADILVKPGVYAESVILSKPVNLVGDTSGGEAVVIECADGSCLSASARGASARNLRLRSAPGFWRRLVGAPDFPVVEIRGGDLVIESCVVSGGAGTGIVVRGENTRPTLRGVEVHGMGRNGVLFTGGSGGTLEGSEVYETGAPALQVEQGSDPLILRSKFHHSRSVGIFIHAGSFGLVEDSFVYENRAAGVNVAGESSPTFRNTVVRANAYSGFEITDGADPLIEGCRIYGGESGGFLIYGGGRGRIVKSDIHSNRRANVTLRDGARLTISKSKIYGGQQAGVLAVEGGEGTVEQCEIMANLIGVDIAGGSKLVVVGSKIMHNLRRGVAVQKGGYGSVTGSDLRRNGWGPWLLDEGAWVDRADNLDSE